jgi:type I restriction enzyme S subunit
MRVDFNHIPKDWKKVKIAKKLFFQEGPGVRKWQFTDKGIKLLNVGNINNGKVDLSATDKHLSTEEATGKYAHFLVDEGDLLIACSGIVVDNFHNKIAFAKKEHLPLCLNTSTMRFRPLEDDVNLNYFKYYLQTVHFTSQLQKLITGSAQLNFGPSHIKKIDFLLPPLKTQKQIASILDNAAALCDKTAQLLKEYDLLAQSIFLEMFGDPGINNKKHFSTNIKNICKVKGGKRIPKGESLVKNKTMHPYIKAGNIKKGKITTTDLEYLTEDLFKKISRYTVEENDVCITVVGANIGDVGIVPQELHLANLTENANKLLIIDKQKLNYMYLAYYLMSNFFQTQIDNNIRAAGVPKLAIFRIEETRILVPPINLQNQFAEKIALIEKQKALAKQELQESEDLFNCLLQKAFKGELV